MLALALVMWVAAEEPSPPPLIPVEPGAELQPAFEPARGPEPVEAEVQESDDPSVTAFYTPRVLVVGATSTAIGASLVGGALAFALTDRSGGGATASVGLLSLPVSLFLGTGVSFAIHRMMGGQGGYGAHLAGGAIGGGAGLVICGLIFFGDGGRLSPAALVGGMFALSGLFGAGTALMGELSNSRTLRERRVAVSVLPVKGGAVASVGGVF